VHADPSRPLVYVTFGTILAQDAPFIAVLNALGGLDIDVLATVGHDLDPATLGPAPDNAVIERFVPQDEILGRAAAVVCHAGSGSLLGALAAGVPVVMIPQGADQYWNADACADAGAGIVLDAADLSRGSIEDAVRSVLGDAHFKESASRLASEIAAMPSAHESAS
jgi:MGT family glycosyltransferase